MKVKYGSIAVVAVVSLMSHSVDAQGRAGNAYEFLDLPTTARQTAIGGAQSVLGTDESGFVFHNPAILRDTLNKSIAINITPIAAGILHGSLAYAHHHDKIGTMSAGVQYVNYGTFDWTDELEQELGSFTAQEAALYLSVARQMTPRLTLAATVKPIFSKYEQYSSVGLAMDMGAMYRSADNHFAVGIVLKNVGGQIKTYHTEAHHESLNTDLRIGMTYKPEHAPFRVTMTMQDLFHWNMSTNRDNKIHWGDNIMRHLVIGAEFTPIRNFFVAMGYDQRKRRELRDNVGAAGLSWGFGLRVFKIDIAYACGKYHKAGAQNSISISTNLNRFL
jgi:hypothetical protein